MIDTPNDMSYDLKQTGKSLIVEHKTIKQKQGMYLYIYVVPKITTKFKKM